MGTNISIADIERACQEAANRQVWLENALLDLQHASKALIERLRSGDPYANELEALSSLVPYLLPRRR